MKLRVIKMIELTQIEIEIGYGDDCELVEITRGESLALITRLREAEKDAERYQWLRDIARHEYDVDDFFGGSSDSVDGMIDKAMKENGDE